MTKQKVFALFHGYYEQRHLHSVHSTLEEAKAVDARVRRNWASASDEPDIEEHEVDPPLCTECGYDEKLHVEHPDTWKHQFVSSGHAVEPGDELAELAAKVADSNIWGEDDPDFWSAIDQLGKLARSRLNQTLNNIEAFSGGRGPGIHCEKHGLVQGGHIISDGGVQPLCPQCAAENRSVTHE